jgi:hypothetical protein
VPSAEGLLTGRTSRIRGVRPTRWESPLADVTSVTPEANACDALPPPAPTCPESVIRITSRP